MEHLNETFNEDPQENLRVENDILKLKISAQYGADFSHESSSDLSPEIENEFLKNVLAFEEAHQNAIPAKVFDILDKPLFKNEKELNDREVREALADLMLQMENKSLVLNTLVEYEDRTIYKFITEELFDIEIDVLENVVPGMTTNLIYEDFYPNHRYDINSRANEFLSAWMERSLEIQNWELADNFILADGRILPKQQGLEKIKNMFNSFVGFDNCSYVIKDVNFHLNEDATGMGYAEGIMKYDAIMESGEQQHSAGPFKLYLSMEYGWWQIFYFVLPGFVW